jgi:hypothetical protein
VNVSTPTAKASPAKPRRPRTKLLERDLDLEQVSPQARRQAACILEVLAGLRTPEQAAQTLAVSLQTYYHVEARAMRGLIHGCTRTPPGRTMLLLKQVRGLELRCATLENQLGRYQALLRNAQRGLLPPPPPTTTKTDAQAKTNGEGRRRKHRPVVRALRTIGLLQREQPEHQHQAATPVDPAATSPPAE